MRYQTLHRLAKYNPRAAATIQDLGFRSVSELCQDNGLHICKTFDFLHGRIPVRVRTGEYSEEARKLAAATGCIPEDFCEDSTHLNWRAKTDTRTTKKASGDPWPSIDRGIKKLDEREKSVITLTYWRGLTLQEIGTIYGVSRERVRQIREDVLEKLRIGAFMDGLSRFGKPL